MKLGLEQSVGYFANLLLPLAERMVAAQPQHDSWVLTAPPASHLPTAAILLSQRICALLQDKYQGTKRFSTVRLYNLRAGTSIHDDALDLQRFGQYSRSEWSDRLALIRQNRFEVRADDFKGRGIIFVNDINVTGASQEHISQVFAAAFPDKVNWLYIIDCEKEMGRKHPHLENELNNAGIGTVHEFAAALALNGMRHTAKCISKLFSYEPAALARLLEMLDAASKTRLWEAVKMEPLYEGAVYGQKRELLCKSR